MNYDRTGRDLLATVLSRPDDNLPRLVYADWLEEHNEIDRAAWIRVGVHEPQREFDWLTDPSHNRPRELLGMEGWSIGKHKDRRYLICDEVWHGVSRGFIDSIILEIDLFTGGPSHERFFGGACKHCEFINIANAKHHECPYCHMTGYVNGVVELFSQHPIAQVCAESSRPDCLHYHQNVSMWYWTHEGYGGSSSSVVPLEVWRTGRIGSYNDDTNEFTPTIFPDPLSAQEALSNGYVEVGRKLAGVKLEVES